MNLEIKIQRGTTVVSLPIELDGKTVPDVQRQILDAATPGGKMIFDCASLTYMSTAGFKFLLVIHRSVVGSGGKVVLAGLSENIKDGLEVTGLLDLFPLRDNVEVAHELISSM